MIKTVDQILAQGKNIFVRVGFDVPIEEGKVADDRRIKVALPTLNFLLRGGVRKLRLATHLGRPKGPNRYLTTRKLEPILSKLLGSAYQRIELMENLRFDPREQANDRNFGATLVAGMDAYVNEAFSNSHRAHASMVAAAELLPAYAGLDLYQQVSNLQRLLRNPERPFVVVIGGAKVEDKLPAVEGLLKVADKILVGGRTGLELVLTHPKIVKQVDTVDDLDIGSQTIELFENELAEAKTIFWNGNLGKSEVPRYANGTNEIARFIASLGAYRVIGGGDTVGAVEALGIVNNFDFVSTGGGATLEFLAGKRLPGLAALGYYG